MKKLYLFAAFASSLALGCSPAAAESRLTIGDKAPALNIEHWLSLGGGLEGEDKFQKVTNFADDKVYIVEFWATWCGPCIASMPHLAEMQREYVDRGVQIVSVTDEELDVVKPFLEKEAATAEGEEKTYADITSHYCLTADPDQSVYKDYMEAANQNGIPCAFIVGRGKEIEWIGHPMAMKPVLDQVLDGSWDREAFAKQFKDEQMFEEMQGELNMAMSRIKDRKDTAAVGKVLLPILRNYEKKITSPEIQQQVRGVKLEVLMMADPASEEVAPLFREFITSEDISPITKHDLAWKAYEISMEKEDFNRDVLEAAAAAMPGILPQLSPDSQPVVLDTLAHLQHRLGDTKAALKTAEEAYAKSGEAEEYAKYVEELKKELAAKK